MNTRNTFCLKNNCNLLPQGSKCWIDVDTKFVGYCELAEPIRETCSTDQADRLEIWQLISWFLYEKTHNLYLCIKREIDAEVCLEESCNGRFIFIPHCKQTEGESSTNCGKESFPVIAYGEICWRHFDRKQDASWKNGSVTGNFLYKLQVYDNF